MNKSTSCIAAVWLLACLRSRAAIHGRKPKSDTSRLIRSPPKNAPK